MTTQHDSAALAIEGLAKSFGSSRALDGVSFSVPRGSIFGLLGPNGAGKTTLFSLVAGFLAADEGTISVLGSDVSHISQMKGRITILPQDAAFQRNVPILEQLMFFRLLDGMDKKTAEREVDEALSKVGLVEYRNRGVHSLSHGMQKRMGIAQAFLGEPEVILLDEPTSGLDPQNARQIRDIIRSLQLERRVTTVISSHNLAEIQELCDHVAILDKGRLVVSGSVEDVTRSGRMIEISTRHPLMPTQRDAFGRLPGIRRIVDRGERRYRFELDLGPEQSFDDLHVATLRAVLDAGVVVTAMAEGDSLEETFLRLTGPGAKGD
jgi:ABC-2 type transport system ATP-binding protein